MNKENDMSIQHHYLKILPKYFMDIEKGIKSFEIRFNDRDFKVGDFLHLQEYCGGEYTGREMSREVCYMIDSPEYCKEGFAVLGLKGDYSLSMFPSDVRELKSPFDERAEQFASICDQLIQTTKNTKEVAREIIEHFVNKKNEFRKFKYHQDQDDFWMRTLGFWDYIDNFVGLTGEEILAEIEKKHIGEVTENE